METRTAGKGSKREAGPKALPILKEVDPKTAPTSEVLREANRLTEDGLGSTASNLVREHMKRDDLTVQNLLEIAGFLADHAGPHDALNAYDKALEIDPKCAPALVGIGTMWLGLSFPEKALEAYQKAVEINPNDAESWTRIGVIYFTSENRDANYYNAGIHALEQVVRINPNDLEAWKLIGYYASFKDDYPRAIKADEKWTELEPRNPDAWDCLAAVCKRAGDLVKSGEASRKAEELRKELAGKGQ